MLDIVIGLQWGDEGKGKVVDVITDNYDIIARFQGGPNAGHTLKIGDTEYVLHLIPSGIFRENTINVIGNGVVFDPVVFRQEVNDISKYVDGIEERILISRRAHLILPTHRLLDAAYEKAKGKGKIGSTLRGIGPTYTDKVARNGVRVGDILAKDFQQRLHQRIDQHLKLLDFYGYADFDIEALLEQWLEAVEFVRRFQVINSEYFLNNAIDKGQKVLAEGAQGTLLDIDFGTYPYVTSSSTIAQGASIGLGVPPVKIGKIIGIFKAYTTRVGNGPFPTELEDETGHRLRQQGHEFGATTGRPRRTGWLDLVALRYAVMINGVTELIMTKADVLDGFDTIKAAVKYDIHGEQTDEFPFDLDGVKPVYQQLSGWDGVASVRDYNDLPGSFRQYVRFIENYIGTKISGISVGARRREFIYCK